MALKIFWNKRAINNFDNILFYLEQKFSLNTAKSFAKKVYKIIDHLSEFPEIGTIENAENQIRGFVIVKQVTIFYKVFGEQITILSLFDNRQNPKGKIFKI